MKFEYKAPIIEIIRFEGSDIICTSSQVPSEELQVIGYSLGSTTEVDLRK